MPGVQKRRFFGWNLRSFNVGLLVCGLFAVLGLRTLGSPLLLRGVALTAIVALVAGAAWSLRRILATMQPSVRKFARLGIVVMVLCCVIALAPCAVQFVAIVCLEFSGADVTYASEPVWPAWLDSLLGESVRHAWSLCFGKVDSIYLVGRVERLGPWHFYLMSRLKDAEHLHLYGAMVTDDDLRHIGRMQNLRSLHLSSGVASSIDVTGIGLSYLENLKSLESLAVGDTKLTDDSLVHLPPFGSLRFLALDRTAISDQGLVHLGKLKSLRQLSLNGTHVTDQGIQELRKSLPGRWNATEIGYMR